MTRKELRKSKLTEDGLPKDARDWTEADWRSLHEAMERAKREIAERHKPSEAAK